MRKRTMIQNDAERWIRENIDKLIELGRIEESKVNHFKKYRVADELDMPYILEAINEFEFSNIEGVFTYIIVLDYHHSTDEYLIELRISKRKRGQLSTINGELLRSKFDESWTPSKFSYK